MTQDLRQPIPEFGAIAYTRYKDVRYLPTGLNTPKTQSYNSKVIDFVPQAVYTAISSTNFLNKDDNTT